MKLRPPSPKPGGLAVIAMLIILSILGIFVVANAKRLHQLHTELKIVEHRQMERLQMEPPATLSTNSPALREPR